MEAKRLKFVFWPFEFRKKFSVNFEELTHQIVQDALNSITNHIEIIDIEASQKLGEDDNEFRLEYPFSVTALENKFLLEMLHQMQNRLNIEMNKYFNKFTASLVILSKDFFDVDLNSSATHLATKDCSFNNIIYCSIPVSHYTVLSRDVKRILHRYYNRFEHYSMFTDFEHDRRRMILRFPYFLRERKGDDKESDFVFTLTVRYASIRRILVNITSFSTDRYSFELYFYLTSSPLIHKIRISDKPNNPSKPFVYLTQRGERHVTWDPRIKNLQTIITESPIFKIHLIDITTDFFCSLINRLSAITDLQIELRTLRFPISVKYVEPRLEKYKEFEIRYLFEAILSRGAIVKDFILKDERERDNFFDKVYEEYHLDKALALEVIESVLRKIDECLDCEHPLEIFLRCHEQTRRNMSVMRQIHDSDPKKFDSKEGYVKLRKVIITPTRMFFLVPELLMGNRVLRLDSVNYPLDRFIRVIFRDEDWSPIHSNALGSKLIDRFVLYKLRQGINVANRNFNYFGSSNSQMRDNGCYFINATNEEITNFRRLLGSFKVEGAPKMMSRIGQCFTQAREISLALERQIYAKTFDFQGGKDSNNKVYTFSDGVGMMSEKLARQVAKELEMGKCVPSVFQIRFRGFKGVLSVNTSLDKLREWGIENNVVDEEEQKEFKWLDLAIKFRPSQEKFKTPQTLQKLEIVKYSSPISISLNRPVINIMDQVSGMQNPKSHQRIANRIHYLMDIHLNNLTRSLIDEQKARNKLGEFPKLIIYEQLTDLNLTTEPFFRAMIRASVRATLKKLRQKLQIPIPNSLGRAMFGVIDETCQLQHGQIFVRYTKNAFLNLPGPTADRVILKGPVLVTKNPAVVGGDIRMFEAVDIPALRHLSDVIVFPTHGPRPHTDQMAGSDLDGDEYTVIWDEELYLDHNEEAFDYTSKVHKTDPTNEEELRNEMAKFFADYIKQDSIGQIANAFLVNADTYGINSEVCKRIAIKNMAAVDFPKTGVSPEPLVNCWVKNIPPERPERSPDYMEKNHAPAYISNRLNGQLFRRAKEIDDILANADQEDETAIVPIDPLIDLPGLQKIHLELANEHYEAYASNIKGLMEKYGIKTEGELFSGHYVSLRNRISDKDNDDMSFYNTSNLIEQNLFEIFAKFRKQFFETSLSGNKYDFHDLTSIEHQNNFGAKEIFRRICVNPTEEHQLLACAYYKIAYDSIKRKLLSFAWLAWDVLNVVRRVNMINCQTPDTKFSFDPLSDKVTKHMQEFIERRKSKPNYVIFNNKLENRVDLPPNESNAWKMVKLYCDYHLGLKNLLYFCLQWAQRMGIFDNACLNHLHIALILIKFGLNKFPSQNFRSQNSWLSIINKKDLSNLSKIDLNEHHGGIGKKFVLFLEFLASRQFEVLQSIDFSEDLTYNCCFWQGEWLIIHKAAIQTYYQIAFTHRFDSLPSTRQQIERFVQYNPIQKMIEGEPFVIEIPSSHSNEVVSYDFVAQLCERTDCQTIVMRKLPKFRDEQETERLYVSAYGTLQALNNLHSLLTVRLNLNMNENCKKMAILMATAVYEKLVYRRNVTKNFPN